MKTNYSGIVLAWLVVTLLLTACGGGGKSAPTGGGTISYTTSGSISGLIGTVVLQNNGGDDLIVTANVAFTFSTQVANGSSYNVTVLSQPIGQSCSVSSGTGTIALANVTNVSITCANSAYTIIDLGTLGGTLSESTGINALGQVVGVSYVTGGAIGHAFLYASGVMQDLGTLSGTISVANSINDSGQITGNFSGSSQHAFLYSSGTMRDIGQYMVTSNGVAINNAGQIVGSTYGPPYQAYLYDNGVRTVLGTLGTGYSSNAFGINNLGQVTGNSDIAYGSNTYHAFVYSNGVMQDIGSLGGSSNGYAINDLGQVTGTSTLSVANPYYQHAFIYSNGVMQDIGTLIGSQSSNSVGYSISKYGRVVGSSDSTDTSVPQHAFIYSASTGILDLNTLLPSNSGWVLREARGINDKGQIVGTGVINGLTHAYLLTPAP